MNLQSKYVRITSLSNDDIARERIEGICSGGSINLDGASAVRRSCTLSINVSDPEHPINDAYWGFNNKFKVEQGVKDEITNETRWYNMGVYIVNSYSRSESTSSLTISISGQDKMCRLNGSISGSLPHEVAFGVIDIIDNQGNVTTKYLPLDQIIRNAVKEYAQEREENIVINDLDQYGYELWEYRGDTPVYIYLDSQTKSPLNISTYTALLQKLLDDGETFERALYVYDNEIQYYTLNSVDPLFNKGATKFQYNGNRDCYLVRTEYGQVAGYHQIPLLPSSDLVLNAGEAITSLLDKIKNQLGNFEYFYDVNGKFIFQKKNNYIQELFSPQTGEVVTPTLTISPYSYEFNDNELVTQFSDSPKLDNVKNDFIVWGTKKGVSGQDIKVHARFAIDTKPVPVQDTDNIIFKTKEYSEEIVLVYISVSEYTEEDKNKGIKAYTRNDLTGFHYVANSANLKNLYKITIHEKSPDPNDRISTLYQKKGEDFLFTTQAFLEQCRLRSSNGSSSWPVFEYLKSNSDFKSYSPVSIIYESKEYKKGEYDWREVIYQMALDFYRHGDDPTYPAYLEQQGYKNGKTGYEQYYSDLQGFWRQLYDPNGDPAIYYTADKYKNDVECKYKYWNKLIHQDPSQLPFWIDFLDVGDNDYGLARYAVRKIGQRTKVINDTAVKSVFSFSAPEVRYVTMSDRNGNPNSMESTNAYVPFYINPEWETLFTKSARGISAIERINELLYQHSHTANAVTITVVPNYEIELNTRVKIHGEDYTVDRISYQLNHNGLMTLTCTKIAEQLF